MQNKKGFLLAAFVKVTYASVCISVYLFSTAGEQADVEQGLVAELRRVVTEHGVRPSNSHPFLLQPTDQPEQLTVALKGVNAQVTGREGDAEDMIL